MHTLESILAMADSYDTEYSELRRAIVFFVEEHCREDVVVLYYRLEELCSTDRHYYSTGLIDILDAMTGYCHQYYLIGTADYNLVAG